MRFLLDTNVWISYLLARDESNTIRQLVGVCTAQIHAILVPPEVFQELRVSIARDAYLGRRITQHQVDALIELITQVAELPEELAAGMTGYVRDPKDDYLIAYALSYAIDYLVTGDLDLLAVESTNRFKIVQPAEMRRILEQQGLWSL